MQAFALCIAGRFERFSGPSQHRKTVSAILQALNMHSKAAASFKITQKGVPVGRNFHLTSRDIARKLVKSKPKEQGEL